MHLQPVPVFGHLACMPCFCGLRPSTPHHPHPTSFHPPPVFGHLACMPCLWSSSQHPSSPTSHFLPPTLPLQINLSPDKASVLREVYRVLAPGGEMFFSDVYCDRRLPHEVGGERGACV
jgi:SAM-dependent methyltransferase